MRTTIATLIASFFTWLYIGKALAHCVCPSCPIIDPDLVTNPYTMVPASSPYSNFTSIESRVIRMQMSENPSGGQEQADARCIAWVLQSDGALFQALVSPPFARDGFDTFAASAMCDGFAVALHSQLPVVVTGETTASGELAATELEVREAGWIPQALTQAAYTCAAGSCSANGLSVKRIVYELTGVLPCQIELENGMGLRFLGITKALSGFVTLPFPQQNRSQHATLKVCSAAAAALGSGATGYVASATEFASGRLEVESFDVLMNASVWGSGFPPSF
jgi:hypothetical protein